MGDTHARRSVAVATEGVYPICTRVSRSCLLPYRQRAVADCGRKFAGQTQSLRMRSSASGNWRSVKRELRVATSRRDPADCLAGGMRRSTIVTQFIIVLGLGGLGAL